MKAWTTAALLLAAAHTPACLWDYDTLGQESRGLPELQDVIAGRFEVNPPEYYERRIELMEEKRAKGTLGLADYDNAAMAHDRLGRTQEAYAWLDAKLQRLKKEQPKMEGDDWYTFYANRGTVFSHDWSRQGLGEGDPALLDKALADLGEALKINPNAHFGREAVQVEILKLAHSTATKPNADYETWRDYVAADKKAVQKGVIGIMSLGIGWNNPDLYVLLASTVGFQDGVLREALLLRAEKFGEAGQKHWISEGDRRRLLQSGGNTEDKEHLRTQMAVLVANGHQFRASRQEFVKAQLEGGWHPDKDADFWDGLPDVPRANLPGWEPRVVASFARANLANIVMGVLCGGPILIIGLSVTLPTGRSDACSLPLSPLQRLWQLTRRHLQMQNPPRVRRR